MTYHFNIVDREKMITNERNSLEKDTNNENLSSFLNCNNNTIAPSNEKENTTNNIANDTIFGFDKEQEVSKKIGKRKNSTKEASGRKNLKRYKILKGSEKIKKYSVFNSVKNKKEAASTKQNILRMDNTITPLKTRENSAKTTMSNCVFKTSQDLHVNTVNDINEDNFLDMEVSSVKHYAMLQEAPPSYVVSEAPDIEFPSVVNGMLLSCRVFNRSTGLESNISPCIVTEGQVEELSPNIDEVPQASSPIRRGYYFMKLLRDCIYGKVYAARTLNWSDYYQQFVYTEDSSVVAIKCIDRSKLDYPEFNLGGTGISNPDTKSTTKMTTAEDAIREISLLQQVSSPGHANVQQVIDVIMDANCVYLVSPFYTGGELFNHVDKTINIQKLRFSQKRVKQYMREILSGVKYLHREMKICHHDLSLENILLDDQGHAIIIDFGMACKLPEVKDKLKLSSKSSSMERSSPFDNSDENVLDTVSVITDQTEFFDFDDSEDTISVRPRNTGDYFCQQLSNFFLFDTKPESKISSSVFSDSSKSTHAEHVTVDLKRITTLDTIDIDLSSIFGAESNCNRNSHQVADSQVSKRCKIKSRGARIGKVTYMTPEIWNNEDFDGEAIDMWACGIILFILLVGFPPFEEPSENDNRFNLIMKGELQVLLNLWGIGPDIVPIEALDMINKLLRQNPWERLSVEEALAHPYLKKVD